MVSLVMFCGTVGVVVGAWGGRRVMKVQIATMLKGRVMNGREKVLRRLFRALVMNMLKQKNMKLRMGQVLCYLATAPINTDTAISILG